MININKIVQLAKEIGDLLAELESNKILSFEQSDIIAMELDPLFKKILLSET